MFRKKKKSIIKEYPKFILSDNAIYFIKNFALTELKIELPIDEDKFYLIYDFACDCELNMVDDDGYDIQENYPEKERDVRGDKFVTEVSGHYANDDEPDLDDLNKRL